MKIYQLPFAETAILSHLDFRAQVSPPAGETLIPQCDDQAGCSGQTGNLGVISCDPGSNVQIVAFVPDVNCSEAASCSISNIFFLGSPVDSLCSDPVAENCDEGGCRLLFDCDVNHDPGDPNCFDYTAEIQCQLTDPVFCENNVPD